jgi:predicted DNA-binding transcriptional regulator YafY
MGKRADTTETLVLALELMRRIPRGRKVTAQELRDQLESVGIVRDLRTVQRQLQLLVSHFDIECDDRTRPFGYSWSGSAKVFAVPNLTPQESLLLLLAQMQLQNLLPASLFKAMEAFFEQAKRNLGPDSTAVLEKQWPQKVRVVATEQPLLPPKINPTVFEEVSGALFKNLWLDLQYKNAEGKVSDIEVMPLGLAQQGPRLYLVCRYKNYTNERSLALHRIQRAQAQHNTFIRPAEFDLEKYDNDGRFRFGEGEMIKLTFVVTRDTGAHLSETPVSHDQDIRVCENGDLEVKATVADSVFLWRWLYGLKASVTGIHRL